MKPRKLRSLKLPGIAARKFSRAGVRTQPKYDPLEPRQLLATMVDSPIGDTSSTLIVQEQRNVPDIQLETLSIPNGTPQSFTVNVPHQDQNLTISFVKHSVRGENFQVLVAGENGKLIPYDAGPERTYIGDVAELPGATVGAVLTDAGLKATVTLPNGSTLAIEPVTQYVLKKGLALHQFSIEDFTDVHGESAAGSASVDLHPGTDPQSFGPANGGGNGFGPTYDITVKQVEIGFEVVNSAFQNRYSSNVQTAVANMESFVANRNAEWIRDALIKHVVGTIIVRTDAATDPFNGYSGTTSELLNAFRNRWNSNPGNENGGTHDLAALHHGTGGGGLAWVGQVGESYRYGIGGANTAAGWQGYMSHEVGHIWGLGHSHGRQELKPGGIQFGVMWSGPHDRATSDEAQRMIQERDESNSGAVDIGEIPASTQIAPYGRRDDVMALIGTPLTIDVIANDYDANEDELDLELRDSTSNLGATITLSSETGPGGRNELIYTPAAGTSGTDYFHYHVVDGTGKTNWGYVEVNVIDPTVIVDLSQTKYEYDFGTTTSPVFTSNGNYVRISPATIGDITWSGDVYGIDRGSSSTANDINRDLVSRNATRTLEHKIKNGVWSLLLNMGDDDIPRDNMVVKAEGITVDDDVDSEAGEFTYVTASEITVTDGSFSLELSDLGGQNSHWALTRMVLTRVRDLPVVVDLAQTSFDYDFGPAEGPVQNGWTQIKPETYGDIHWSTTVNAVDRGQTSGVNNINRDLVYLNETATLNHKIANGTWDVTINMGDVSFAHDNMTVRAEGILRDADVDSDVASFPYVIFEVEVTDGELNVEFADTGGSDPNWVLTRMSLRRDFGQPPNAADDNYAVGQDSSLTTIQGVDDLLLNDTDPEGKPLTVNTTPVTAPSNGSLVLQTNGTFTYTPTNGFTGTDSFDYEVEDFDGNTATATATIEVVEIPEVSTVGVGDLGIQRSTIDQLIVTFNGLVDLSEGALRLIQRTDGNANPTGTSVSVGVSEAVVDGNTVVTLNFLDTNRSGTSALRDGNYQLTVDRTKVKRAGTEVTMLTDLVFGNSESDKFFSMYGDTDGNRTLNSIDLLRFRQTYQKQNGDSGFNPNLDFNGDGNISSVDLLAFRNNFGDSLPFG